MGIISLLPRVHHVEISCLYPYSIFYVIYKYRKCSTYRDSSLSVTRAPLSCSYIIASLLFLFSSNNFFCPKRPIIVILKIENFSFQPFCDNPCLFDYVYYQGIEIIIHFKNNTGIGRYNTLNGFFFRQ